MSENSKIEWTNHTFNPWWGCMKVSDGCKNCYAETLDNRYNHQKPHWGPGSDRKGMSLKYWLQPMKWNKNAREAGIPAKVFCASMADVFEDHVDTYEWEQRLWEVIESTPWLIWQLLTKRPENIMKIVPERWQSDFPRNIWACTSVENQKAADERIPHLLRVPASVRGLSCEPLLGPVDLSEYMILTDSNDSSSLLAEERGWGYDNWSGGFSGPGGVDSCYEAQSGIHWVIAGGESGPHARPMHPDWARSLRDQCAYAEVPFFFKQWGEWTPGSHPKGERAMGYFDTAGYWREGQQWHPEYKPEMINMLKVGKHAAGRLLDGVEHNGFPRIDKPEGLA